MTDFDDREFKQFRRDLKRMAKTALPFAEANTMTQLGREAEFIARNDLDQRFTIRNKWTAGSIRSTRATPRRLESRVGSFREYMADQEEGSTRSRNTGIGTKFASGESPDGRSGPRKRAIRARMRKNKLKSVRPRQFNGVTNKQTAFVQAKLALEAGDKFSYIKTSNRDVGIYRVQWRGRSKTGQRKIKMRMVYDLSNRQIRTKKNPWLRPAMQEAARKAPRIFSSFARQELARRGLLK